jgi:hypothetical protein
MPGAGFAGGGGFPTRGEVTLELVAVQPARRLAVAAVVIQCLMLWFAARRRNSTRTHRIGVDVMPEQCPRS